VGSDLDNGLVNIEVLVSFGVEDLFDDLAGNIDVAKCVFPVL
jgi:hypothetical protein